MKEDNIYLIKYYCLECGHEDNYERIKHPNVNNTCNKCGSYNIMQEL